MTQEKEELEIPSLEDFTESSLLDQIQNKEKDEEETDEEKETREAEEAETKRLEEETAKLEQEEKDRLAKEQDEELTEEEKEAKAKEEEGSFWGDVEAITGNTVEVDFGDVDPESPEGAAIREEVVASKAVQSNLAYLEEQFPEGFKVLQHVSNGGQLKDLLDENIVDYSNITIEEADVDSQKTFMKSYYIEKGFSDAKALRNVEDDEDSDEGLYKNFQTALKEKQEAQETTNKATFERQEKIKLAQDAQDKKFGETVSSIISSGKVGNFNIPKKDAESFYNHVFQHIERKDGGYALTIPLTNDNFTEQLQQMFFGFKKGDLGKFVTAKAKTENAARLKRQLKKDKGVDESSSEKEKRTYGDKLPTLGAFEAE